VLLGIAVCALGATTAPAFAHTRHRGGMHVHPGTTARTIPVTFTVVNDNATAIPCFPASADGKTYTVSGSLILPAGTTTPSGVTLYVHGLGYAGWFWNFTSVPGYNYAAAEAAAGHASVVIDRLGYGSSQIPPGAATCIGSQATIIHEIVQDLRAGTYTATGMAAPTFSKIGLVGHSAGGELVEIEAYSFRDINALGIMEWADQFYSLGAYAAFASDALQCVAGNTKQVGSSQTGYATFGQTNAQFNSLMLADAAPAVVSAVDAMRENDPCGQIESILTGTAFDLLGDPSIKVPIAYVHAGRDGIFQAPLPWPSLQEALYAGTSKLTDISLPGQGHAVTLERGAPRLQLAMSAWLTANGL
jgi:pimeloyl-ACP methyl ester carboxylesterase